MSRIPRCFLPALVDVDSEEFRLSKNEDGFMLYLSLKKREHYPLL